MSVEDPCPACKNLDCKSEGPEPWECLEAQMRKEEREPRMDEPMTDKAIVEAVNWCWAHSFTIEFLQVAGVRIVGWTIDVSSLRFQNPIPVRYEGVGRNLALAIEDWKKNAGPDNTLMVLENGKRRARRSGR